ncbi:MAG: DUF3327 domain-containing protein, partial [Deltaproteobacteria bacterium]|nr:DUF3327 domain-containing protein [Deltaproteobacteria bacterium]
MRTLAVLVGLVSWVAATVASAEPSPSPRIAAVAAKPSTEAAFWKQVAAEGTPLIEDIKDPKGRLLLTFVYRARPTTKHVAIYNAPNNVLIGYGQLERIPKTNVFATSMLVDPAARFIYALAPNDNFGVPVGMADVMRRMPLLQPDLLNKHPIETSGSAVTLPKAPPQPWRTPKRGTPTGTLTQYLTSTKGLPGKRPVLVYTPPGFSTTGPAYPLVVLFDGPGVAQAFAMPLVLEELIAAKKLPPVVVAMVGNADRMAELLPTPAFADHVAHDLVPWIRRTFHTTADPRSTVLGGLSLGGLAAAYTAIRHPATFGNVLSQSGSFWWSPDDAIESEHVSHDLAARSALPIRFWIECGVFESGSPKPDTSQIGANRHLRD